MTETETNDSAMTPELRTWIDAWKTSAQQVLSQVSSKTIAFDLAPAPTPAAEPAAGAPSDVNYTIAASGAVRGEMVLRVSSATGAAMAQMFMGATDPPSTSLNDELKEGLEELLRQIAGQAATTLKAAFGGDVQLQVSASAPPSWPAAASASLRAPEGAESPLAIDLQMSAALVATLQPRPTEAAPAATASAAERRTSPPPGGNYDRLLDVGLEVKLCFGARRMILRDVLALSAGAVVELDRKLQAPADLLLDGRLVAQGEVVVVDGKYGLRVTEVFDPRPVA
jgi:flagellar motor switch protein FliN